MTVQSKPLKIQMKIEDFYDGYFSLSYCCPPLLNMVKGTE